MRPTSSANAWLIALTLALSNTRSATAGTLSVAVVSADAATGRVVINGVDTQRPTTPFTFDWGDQRRSDGFFPQTHTYADRSRSYGVSVTAHYAGGATDAVQTTVQFATSPAPAPPGRASTSLLPFDYKQALFGTPATLGVNVQSRDAGTGDVVIGGGDARGPTTPFTFVWGDGSSSDGFFPTRHHYADTTRNYPVQVTAHYSDGTADTASTLVWFAVPRIRPVALPAELVVTVPDHAVALTNRLSGDDASSGLSFFDDSFFDPVPRTAVEYVLAAVASIERDFVNGDVLPVDGGFKQVVVKDPTPGGMHALWFTDPVAVAVQPFDGGYGLKSSIEWSSFFHEMGHNFTLNTPSRYVYGGKIDGNANALFSECMAQLFQHAAAYELINHYGDYGLSEELAWDIRRSATASMQIVAQGHDAYVRNGHSFASWNDPGTPADETFPVFMTLAYTFCTHAESQGQGYRQPLKRMVKLLQLFDADLAQRYDAQHNTPQANTLRSTLMVAAVSYAFAADLRAEFRDLGFPVDDTLFLALLQRAG
jgi:hypothetical protein